MAMRRLLSASVLGRDAETRLLEEGLDDAAAGRGGVVLLSGEAGVGKSRLARELVASARRRGLSVLVGRAMDSCTPSAFGPFVEAFLSYFRGSAPPPFPELDPFKPVLARLIPHWTPAARTSPEESLIVLAEAIVRLLAAIAAKRGCLLILEDLHWADPETLAIVDYLSDTLDSEHILCVGTLRADESSRASGLRASMHTRRAGRLIDLERLDDDGVQQMIGECLGGDVPPDISASVTRFSDGLPFLVEELLAAWADAGALVRSRDGWVLTSSAEPIVPETFADTVCRRVRTIGGSALLILGAAAVLGGRFDWLVLVRATGLGQDLVIDTLRRAVDAQLCVADTLDGSFRFRHALTRHAVLGSLLPVERRTLAGKLLEALMSDHEALSADSAQQAAELAQAAGDRARAARLLLEAASEARLRGALTTAEAFLERARSLGGERGDLAAEIGQALAEVLVAAGKPVAALEIGERLCRPGSGLDPCRTPALRLVLSRAATLAGMWPDAERHIAEARACTPTDDPGLLAEVDLVEAQALMAQKRTTEATALARRALAAAKEAEAASTACEALMIVGRAERFRDLVSANAAFAEAGAWAQRLGSVEAEIRAAFELATIPLLDGGSIEPLLATRAAAVDAGMPVTASYVDLMLAHRHEDRLELDLTRQVAQRCFEAARRYRLRPLMGSASTQLAFAHGAMGDRRQMEKTLATAEVVAGDDPDVVAGARIARAMVALLAEDRAAAMGHLDAAMHVLRSSGATYPAPHRGLWALLHVVDDDDVADGALAEVKASAATVHRAVQGLLHCADAVRLGRWGRTCEAEQAWSWGEADLSSFVGRLNVARRLSAESALEHGWGQPVAWLGEAAEFFEAAAVPRMAAACRSLLRTAGEPVRRTGSAHDRVPEELRRVGITAREMEVLDLLAEGLSTATIATRLFLSVKTVERHTANLATKLGLAGRARVVAFAAARRGVTGETAGVRGAKS